MIRWAHALPVLLCIFQNSGWAEDSFNPGIKTVYGVSALSGGTTFQASETRGTSYGSFQINVSSNGSVKLVRATRSIETGIIGDANPLPSSGTLSYTASTESCLTSESATMTSSASACNQYTIPSAPYSSTNFTAPSGATAGYFHQVATSCPSFDPVNTTGWTWSVGGTVITYGSGSRPLLGKNICTVQGYDLGGNKVLVSSEMGVNTITSGPGSTCRQVSQVNECYIE
jgi:hypothetical protein